MVHGERARRSGAFVRGAYAADFFAVDPRHQRDSAVGLTTPGQGQFGLCHLHEELPEPSFHTAERDTGREQALHQRTKHSRNRLHQILTNVGHRLEE